MNELGYSYTDPQNGLYRPLLPGGTTLLNSVEGIWNGILLLEEYRLSGGESREICASGPLLLFPRTTESPLEFRDEQNRIIGTAKAGELVIMPANMPVQWQCRDEHEVLVLMITARFLRQVIPDEDAGSLGFVCGVSDPRLERMALVLRDQFDRVGSCGSLLGEGMAAAICLYLFQEYRVNAEGGASATAPVRTVLTRPELAQALEYIQENLGTDLSLNDIAGVACLSPTHFCRLFRQTLGVSPHQYVLNQRVDRAMRLIASRSDMTITEIASAVGFCDHSHLICHMKRLRGITPSQLRSGRTMHRRNTLTSLPIRSKA
ncbi:MAG: hypothetical protein OHK0029_33080 [Armatimonadaceae bacterium]